MQAKEISMYILAFSLGIGIVNTLGIFSPINTIDVSDVNNSLMDGVSEISDSVNMSSSNDLIDSVTGVSMFLSVLDVFWTMLTLATVPGIWLYGIGVPWYLCLPVQVMVNATMIWGAMMFVSGRSDNNIG